MMAGSLVAAISASADAPAWRASWFSFFSSHCVCRVPTPRARGTVTSTRGAVTPTRGVGSSSPSVLRWAALIVLALLLFLSCTRPGLAQTVQALNLVPAGVTGGGGSTGTVMLSAPATANIVVTLVKNVASTSLPATLTIPQGQQSGSFAITTTPVAQQASGTIGATINNQGPSVPFTVYPAQFNIPGGFTLSPTAVTAGQPVTGTINLNGPACQRIVEAFHGFVAQALLVVNRLQTGAAALREDKVPIAARQTAVAGEPDEFLAKRTAALFTPEAAAV